MSYKKLFLLVCLGTFFSYGRNLNAQSQTFNYTGSLQAFTVPCATSITITANGAQGGTGIYGTGGLGATIGGTFAVTPGQVLDIVVGQVGNGSFAGPYYCGSGGGGTYVWNSANSTLPMIVAGGGGGYAYNCTSGPGSATQTPSPSIGDGGSAAGGSGGGGGTGSYSGGGAGWISNGTAGSNGGGGVDPGNGAAGGVAGSPGAAGGYGGGGGCGGNDGAGAGGGGYNGGGGGTVNNNWGAGGGGGSYNAGTNPTAIAGNWTGSGSVVITWTVANLAVTNTGVVIANEQTCNGQTGSAYGKATGVGLTYLWAPSGGTRDTATGLTAGTYTITVSSLCGGSASAAVTITQPANVITATTNINANVLCHGGNNGSATVNISGIGAPYTYAWTPIGGNAATANGLSAGVYTVKVVNACGATASATATITQPASLSITASTTANISCFGNNNGSVYGLVGFNSGTPPYKYAWSPVGGNLDTVVGLAAGSYTVNLTDANGCTGSASTTITQPNVLTASATAQANALCNGMKTGSTATIVNGGTGPYTYMWTGGQTGASASSLGAGTYTVSITDAHGCTTSAQATITQPTSVKVVANLTVDSGHCTGSAWVVVTGGVVPYAYLWSNGNTTYYINGQCGTKEYCYKITDAQGCIDSNCVSINSVLGVGNVTASAGKVTVYPNPTSGQFTIQLSAFSNQWSVEVYNILGERVYTQSNNHNATSDINLGNQPNGIYLYRVISNEDGNMVGQGKIVLDK